MHSDEEKKEFLLKHARHPKRVGEFVAANGRGRCHNPLCGDRVNVDLEIVDGGIKDIKILPTGCSISIASASMMTDVVHGKSLLELEHYMKIVHESFMPKKDMDDWPELLNELSALKRIRENPLKIPCVLIGWMALKDAIRNYQELN